MVRDIPQQLRDSRIRFYLIGSNSKIPIEAAWNKTGNYHYDDPKLLRHMGNYGVVCGLGGVIVLDFDDKEYHEGMKHLLPETFVVITAGKQLPHYYYFLEGNEMFKKIGVNNREGKRVCDIQALGSGVVAPGSRYKERFYTPNCIAIQTITLAQLACIFNLNEKQDIEKKSDFIQETILTESGAKLVKEDKITVDDFEGTRLDFEPTGEGEKRSVVIFSKGDYSYSISTVPEQVEKVIESFKFLE